MVPILETRALSKHYRSDWTFRRIVVLDSLNLAVEEGEIFGLLGPNGAGKTTTFKLLLGLLRPTRGSVLFRGVEIQASDRAFIGFLPERPYFYDYLSVQEALSLFAQLNGIPAAQRRGRIDEVVERLQLTAKRRAALHTLSKGLLQRVGVAQAILAKPKLVILDEPMSGLDPTGRRDMRDLISELRAGGTAVIFSSHILPDVEALCDRVAILVEGRLREIVSLSHQETPPAYDVGWTAADSEALEPLTRLAGLPPQRNGQLWHVQLPSLQVANEAVDLIRRTRGFVAAVTPRNVSLEQRFLSHVGDAPPRD